MLSLTSDQQASLEGDILTLCTCWDIYRTDGYIFRVTDHDIDVELAGNRYSPVGGFNATAIHRDAALKDRNREFVGVVEVEAINDDDLRAGKYRNQQIKEYLIDWEHPEYGAIYTNIYWIDTVTFNGEQWTVSVVGVTGWLRREIGNRYDRICSHILGDEGCRVNLISLTETGTISVVSGGLGSPRLAFTATGLVQPDAFYNDGKIIFTSGANANLSFEVQTWATGVITLWLQTPYDVQVGDTFTIIPGCDRLRNTCVNKYTNLINFGGFPFIPGTDRMLTTPQ